MSASNSGSSSSKPGQTFVSSLVVNFCHNKPKRTVSQVSSNDSLVDEDASGSSQTLQLRDKATEIGTTLQNPFLMEKDQNQAYYQIFDGYQCTSYESGLMEVCKEEISNDVLTPCKADAVVAEFLTGDSMSKESLQFQSTDLVQEEKRMIQREEMSSICAAMKMCYNEERSSMYAGESNSICTRQQTSHASKSFSQSTTACDSSDFIFQSDLPASNCNLNSYDSADTTSPKHTISLFRGHVRQKSKTFESSAAVQTRAFADVEESISVLPVELDGIVHDKLTSLNNQVCTERHESQVVGGDTHSVDGHVKVKQSLFETLPVDALYERGETHSSQIITKGRKKLNIDSLLNDFNTKPLSELNEKSVVPEEKEIITVNLSEKISSLRASGENQTQVVKDRLHESQIVHYDVPTNIALVKTCKEQFEEENFKRNSGEQIFLHSSQIVEDGILTDGRHVSIKNQFENESLDSIGSDNRPGKHPSQMISVEMQERSCYDDFSLSELHSSQRIGYHEGQLSGRTQVRSKRRQFYEGLPDERELHESQILAIEPSVLDSDGMVSTWKETIEEGKFATHSYEKREMMENHSILNSDDLSGIVKNTTSTYLENFIQTPDDQIQKSYYRNDLFVKPLASKFESQLQGVEKDSERNVHPSQLVDGGLPVGLSFETQQYHLDNTVDRPGLHTSQLINSYEYAAIKSDVNAKAYAFSITPLSDLNTHSPEEESKPLSTVLDGQVKPMTKAFENCQVSPSKRALHSSQIVKDDFELISASEVQCHSVRYGESKQELHSSQKVNVAIAQTTELKGRRAAHGEIMSHEVSFSPVPTESDFVTPPAIAMQAAERKLRHAAHRDLMSHEVSFSPVPTESDFVAPPANEKTKTTGKKNSTPDDEDLEKLLNFRPQAKEELPSMVTVLTKGVPAELVKAGHPTVTFFPGSKTKKVSVGSRTTTSSMADWQNLEDFIQDSGKSLDFVQKQDKKSVLPVLQLHAIASKEKSVELVQQSSVVEAGGKPVDPVELTKSIREMRRESLPLPSYPEPISPRTLMANLNKDDPLPPPPSAEISQHDSNPFFRGMLQSDPPEITFDSAPQLTTDDSRHPDFVEDFFLPAHKECPGNKNHILSGEEELCFWSFDEENSSKEKFVEHRDQLMTSTFESYSFLGVEEDSERNISTVTVCSLPESDSDLI